MIRWAPGLLALSIVAQIAVLGANTRVLGIAAALANLVLAAAIMASTDAKSRFWRAAGPSLLIFALALGWAAIPMLAPDAVTRALDIAPRPAPDLVLPEFLKALGNLAMLLAAAALGYRSQSARRVIVALVVALGVYVVGIALLPATWRTIAGGTERFSATIGNWNAAGTLFAITAILSAGWLMATRGPQHRHATIARASLSALVIASVLFCAATQSRTAFGMMIGALAVMAMLSTDAWRGRGRIVIAIVIGIAVVIALDPGAIVTRYGAAGADGVARIEVLRHYAALSMEAPVWGHGLGSFFDVNQHALTPETAGRYWNFGAAHNAVIQTAIEAGWPCVLLLGLAVATIAHRIATAPRDRWTIATLAALAVLAGGATIDVAWNVPALASLGSALLGTIWGVALRHVPAKQPKLHRKRRGRAGDDMIHRPA